MTKFHLVTISVLVLIVMSSGLVEDVTAQNLVRGSKIRTFAEGREYTGNLVSLTDEALTLIAANGSDTKTFPINSIGKAEWLADRSGNFKTGALVGGLAGLGLGIATMASDDTWLCDTSCQVLGTGLLTLAGGALGGLIGALIQSDDWEPLPLGQGIQVGFSTVQGKGALTLAARW